MATPYTLVYGEFWTSYFNPTNSSSSEISASDTPSERRITERRIIERRIIERRITERRITECRITERRKLPNVEYYRTSNITKRVDYYRTEPEFLKILKCDLAESASTGF